MHPSQLHELPKETQHSYPAKNAVMKSIMSFGDIPSGPRLTNVITFRRRRRHPGVRSSPYRSVSCFVQRRRIKLPRSTDFFRESARPLLPLPPRAGGEKNYFFFSHFIGRRRRADGLYFRRSTLVLPQCCLRDSDR